MISFVLAWAVGCGSGRQSAQDKNKPVEVGERQPQSEPVGSSEPVESEGAQRALPRRELSWSYPETPMGPMSVVVAIPAQKQPGVKFPVLVALHGGGESFKGPARGARGWIDDYDLWAAVGALGNPPLSKEALRGLYGTKDLKDINERVERRPYQGLIVVCPYTPLEVLGGKNAYAGGIERYSSWLVDEVLPRVYRETPAIGTARSTGIDGVSLGGRGAFFVAMRRPEAFGAVGAMQPVLRPKNKKRIIAMAKKAFEKNPELSMRLLTSTDDVFYHTTRFLGRELQSAKVPVEVKIVPGPHDYIFNRGPGGVEMLLFHDERLRGPER